MEIVQKGRGFRNRARLVGYGPYFALGSVVLWAFFVCLLLQCGNLVSWGDGSEDNGRSPLSSSRMLFLQIIRAHTLVEAQTLVEKIRQGIPFESLVRSHAPEALREKGGYLGMVREDLLRPILREAIAHLNPGEVSGPIRVDGDYLVVKRIGPEGVAALRACKGTAEYYLNLGLVLGEISDQEGEVKAYRQAIELNPDLTEAYVNLGEALRRKAVRILQGSEGLRGGSSETKKVVRSILDDAIEQFKLALKHDPNLAEAHYDLGLAYAMEGLYDLALIEFKEALRHKPGDGEIQKSLAAALFLKGEYEKAHIHARRAKALGAEVDELISRIDAKRHDFTSKGPGPSKH